MSVLKEKPKLLRVKLDYVFKLIFGDQRNTDILAGFLKSVLDIPDDEYLFLTVIDPHLKKESLDDKYAILDVKVHTKSGIVIHVEIQVESIDYMEQRIIYDQSKMITEQVKSGDHWRVINRVVTIVITDFPFPPSGTSYHHAFSFRTKDGLEFSRLKEIHTLDLSKLPSINDDTYLWSWAKFMKSDNSEEELDMLAEKSPELKRAVGVLKELSADERTRMLAEEREIGRRNYLSGLEGAEQKGRQEGIQEGIQKGRQEGRQEERKGIARNLLLINMSVEEISKATGLTREEVESLT
jgi:predicted transposase/invertase (TIGR01784 family)